MSRIEVSFHLQILHLFMKMFVDEESINLLQGLEQVVHGRGRNADSLDETYLGVHEELLYARKINPVEGNISKLLAFGLGCYG